MMICFCTGDMSNELPSILHHVFDFDFSHIVGCPFKQKRLISGYLMFCSVLCLQCLCARLFICALWSSAGKG